MNANALKHSYHPSSVLLLPNRNSSLGIGVNKVNKINKLSPIIFVGWDAEFDEIYRLRVILSQL